MYNLGSSTGGSGMWVPATHMGQPAGLGAQALNLAWSSLGKCRHLVSESAGELSLSPLPDLLLKTNNIYYLNTGTKI